MDGTYAFVAWPKNTVYVSDREDTQKDLQCYLTFLESGDRVLWQKYRTTISLDDQVQAPYSTKYRRNDAHHLHVQNPELDDAGTYMCRSERYPDIARKASLIVLSTSAQFLSIKD